MSDRKYSRRSMLAWSHNSMVGRVIRVRSLLRTVRGGTVTPMAEYRMDLALKALQDALDTLQRERLEGDEIVQIPGRE
jgi:hypothetical protein